MRTLRNTFIFISILLLAFLLIALFAPKKYSVEREIVINKNQEMVFNYLKYLKNQDHYSTWARVDLNMKKIFKGTDGKVGFVISWESGLKSVGKREEEITAISEFNRIDYEMRFIKPRKYVSKVAFILSKVDENKTKVTWIFYNKIPYPFNIKLLFFNMDKAYGSDLEKGLDNLRTILNNKK